MEQSELISVLGDDYVLRAFSPDVEITEHLQEEQPDVIIYHVDYFHPSKNQFGHVPKIWFVERENLTQEEQVKCFEKGVDLVQIGSSDDFLIPAKVKGTLYANELKEDYVKKKVLFGERGTEIKSKETEFMERIYDYLSENCLNKEFSIEKMSKDLAMSRTNFFSKVKSITGASPSKLVMNYRLANAVVLIQENHGNITEIAYKVGFTSTAYFTKCFKERFGIKPSQMSKMKSKVTIDHTKLNSPDFHEELAFEFNDEDS